MSMIVSNCQHCDEQQFQTPVMCTLRLFSVVKLDLVILAFLLDRILALEKLRIHLVISCECYLCAQNCTMSNDNAQINIQLNHINC